MINTALHAAYERSTYWVELPECYVPIRIGQNSPELDRWVFQQGHSCWAFVTACNPQSQLRTPSINHVRNSELRHELQQSGRPIAHGIGVGCDGQWPPETSFCVAGLTLSDATQLASQFGQAAFVYGDCGLSARLVTTR